MAAEQEATDSTTNLSLYGALIQDDLNNLRTIIILAMEVMVRGLH